MIPCVCASGQSIELKGKVQLTRSGRNLRDASKVVVWLTAIGTTPAPTPAMQKESQIPQLVQKDKSFSAFAGCDSGGRQG